MDHDNFTPDVQSELVKQIIDVFAAFDLSPRQGSIIIGLLMGAQVKGLGVDGVKLELLVVEKAALAYMKMIQSSCEKEAES